VAHYKSIERWWKLALQYAPGSAGALSKPTAQANCKATEV
jgi:hypothetical protein